MLIYTFKNFMGDHVIMSHFDFMPYLEGVHPLYVDGCLTLYDGDFYTTNPETLDKLRSSHV